MALEGEGGLPKADFRLRGDALDPLAAVKVLAVMCHPTDARSREVLLRRMPSKITISREQAAAEWSGDLRLRAIWGEFREHGRWACLAGAVTLACVQLRSMKQRGDRAAVIALAASIARQWDQAVAPDAAGAGETAAPPRREADILRAFQLYRSVSHLWAALVYGRLKHRQDLLPQSAQTLPSFLAYGEELARLAAALPWQARDPELVVEPDALWSFVLPERVKKTARAQIAPPPPVAAPPKAPSPAAGPGPEARPEAGLSTDHL